MPVTGWAARRWGAKRVYLVSLVLFTAGSAPCGLSTSLPSLVVFRVLQGIGGGMIMPVAQLIMAQVAGPRRMGRVMGIVSMPAMLAPILGPVLGGVILQGLHWSWIFFVNVPIGVVAFVLGWRVLPQTDSGEAGKLDLVGLALLPTGAAATSSASANSAPARRGLRRSARAGRRRPGADRRVRRARAPHRAAAARRAPVRNRVFAGASLTTFGAGAALFGAMILVPLYYQRVRGENVIDTGLLNAPQGLGPWSRCRSPGA